MSNQEFVEAMGSLDERTGNSSSARQALRSVEMASSRSSSHRFIVDAEGTRANRIAEIAVAETMIDRVARRFDLHPQRLAGDTVYGAARLLKALVDRNITPHVPVWDKSARPDGTFSRADLQSRTHEVREMFGFRKVRKAHIPDEDRAIFERYGETVIQMIAAGGFSPRAVELQPIYGNDAMITNAVRWLTEQGDIKHNHERRIEVVEWAILIFVVLGVVVESAALIHEIWK